MVAERQVCPRCHARVNAGNLASHVARVHPRDRVEVPAEALRRADGPRGHRAPMSRGQRRALLGGVGVVLGIVVAALALPAFLTPVGGTIHLEPTSYDFGNIGQDTVSTTFRLHNRGTTTLALQGVSTSCMCTTARVVFQGRVSPTFGNHGNPAWSLAMPPGTEALVDVFYDPTVHPELGHFVREVYILSSDPALREASVQIHATEV